MTVIEKLIRKDKIDSLLNEINGIQQHLEILYYGDEQNEVGLILSENLRITRKIIELLVEHLREYEGVLKK
jgi:hypothetical protein